MKKPKRNMTLFGILCLAGRAVTLIAFLALPLLTGGCLGGGGSGSKLLNTTPRQDFFRLKVNFNKPEVASDHKELDKYLRELKALFEKIDDPTLKNGIRQYLALVKILSAELDFSQERGKSFDHAKYYAPLKDAYRWCRFLLDRDPADSDTCYLMARTCFDLVRFAPPEALTPLEAWDLYESAFRHLARIGAVKSDFETSFKIGGRRLGSMDFDYLRHEMYLTRGQLVLARHTLDRIHYQYSRTRRDPEYILARAMGESRAAALDDAMFTLSEFKTGEHDDYYRRNLALHLLEELICLKEKYTGEKLSEDARIVAEMRKKRRDFYSTARLAPISAMSSAAPVSSELQVAAYRAFSAGESAKAAREFKILGADGKATVEERSDALIGLLLLATVDRDADRRGADSRNSNHRNANRQDVESRGDTAKKEEKAAADLLGEDYEYHPSSVMAGPMQETFEALAALVPESHLLQEALWIAEGWAPDPEAPVRPVWVHLKKLKMAGLADLAFELYAPEGLADIVVRPRGEEKGLRIKLPKDPFEMLIPAGGLVDNLPWGISIIDLYCKDQAGKIAVIPFAVPR